MKDLDQWFHYDSRLQLLIITLRKQSFFALKEYCSHGMEKKHSNIY